MAQETKQLSKNDEVYIKSLGLYGKVLDIRGADEPIEDQVCTVEIIRYCRPTDLDLIDREAERKKREAEIQRKSNRLTEARAKIAAGDRSNEAALEFLNAADDLAQALGYRPLLVTK
jgi:hypothetical protein